MNFYNDNTKKFLTLQETTITKSKNKLFADNTILQNLCDHPENIIDIEKFTINNKSAILYDNDKNSTNYKDTSGKLERPHVNFRVFMLLSENQIKKHPDLPYRNDEYSITIENQKYYLYSVQYNLYSYIYNSNQCYIIYNIIAHLFYSALKGKNIIINQNKKAIIIDPYQVSPTPSPFEIFLLCHKRYKINLQKEQKLQEQSKEKQQPIQVNNQEQLKQPSQQKETSIYKKLSIALIVIIILLLLIYIIYIN